MKSILYIGWVGFNNLGDDLMFDIFKRYVSQLDEEYKLIPVNNENRFLQQISMTDYDYIVLGGGSLISSALHPFEPYLFDSLARAVQANKKVIVWGSGMDWLPGSTLSAMLEQREMQLDISDRVLSAVKQVFSHSHWCGVRGPLTQSLLASIGIPGVPISGDPAFLMSPPQVDPVSGSDQRSRPIIGVNWGTAYNQIYGADEAIVEAALAKALSQLQAEGYSLYFYTMWDQDREAAKRLYRELSHSGKAVFDPAIYHQDEFVKLISRFEFTINFKLHASYISLSARVPFIALGYRFKVFDFAQSVHMNDFIVPTDAPDLREQILQKASVISSSRGKLIETMSTAQAQYAERIAEPFRLQLFN